MMEMKTLGGKKTLTSSLFKLSPGIVLIFLLCQLAALGGIFAQNSGQKALSAEEFYEIFSEYEDFKSLKALFTQKKIISEMDITLETSGTLLVKRPNEVIWVITQPELMKVQLGPKSLSIISGKGKDQEIEKWSLDQAPKKVKEKLKIMKLWLNFDPIGLYQKYHIYQTSPGQLKFVPKEKMDMGISTLEMHLHKDGYIDQMIFQEESGDTLKYFFQKPDFTR